MKNIDDILVRGVANIIPDKNKLAEALENKKLNVYLGIDPTATKIHLGHAVALRKIQKIAELGHNVTFLIGDFTALIGDTSDKDSERPILTSDEIEENFKTYKKQAEKILDFTKIKVVHNSEWLSKLNFKDVVELTQKFTVNDFISRELIKKRLSDGKSVRLQEVLYPVMQGYDSYHLDTDLQVGGADQTFNMQAGRTLQKLLRNKDSFVLSTEYLIGTDGQKMSKSQGNAIWLDDNPRDMYGKVMSIKDDVIADYFMLATDTPIEKVDEVKKAIKSGENPINYKKALAFEIVSQLHSEKDAEDAQKYFEQTVQNKQLPEDMPTVTLNPDNHSQISELLVELGLAGSRSEAKRLVEQGAVLINEELIEQPNLEIIPEDNMIIKAGKRSYVRIKLSSE